MNTNLRHHLYKLHPQEYDHEIKKQNWNYRLLTQSDSASVYKNICKTRNEDIPPFSAVVFQDHLVHFVIVDDQVGFNYLSFVFTLTYIFSRSVLLNVLSYDGYLWSSAWISSTPTSLATIR